jgi:hypothetical protein
LNFKTKVFEFAFGDDAINKKYSDAEVLEKIEDFVEKSLLFEKMQEALQEEGYDINKGVSD